MHAERPTRRRTPTHHRTPGAAVVGAAIFAALFTILPRPLIAEELLRGDVNGDGEVTVADAVTLALELFFGREVPCEEQGDFTGDGDVSLGDVHFIVAHVGGDVTQFRFGRDPAYPPPPMVSCEAVPEPLDPIVDSAARLEVLEATAAGGDDPHAWITVGLSNSVPLWAFSGVVELGDFALDTVTYNKDRIGCEVLLEPFRTIAEEEGRSRAGEHAVARVEDGRLHFAFYTQSFAGDGNWIEPGDSAPALRIKVCLDSGTPAGGYALEMASGEFTRAWTGGDVTDANDETGRVIDPALQGGTLSVLEDVGDGLTCHVRPLRDELDARFELTSTAAPPGGQATVHLVIRADRASDGFGFHIHFDPDVLQVAEIEKLYPPAPGETPYRDEILEFDNVEGRLTGFVQFTLYETSYTLPAHRDHRVLAFHFDVASDPPADSTEIRFDEDPRRQIFRAFADTYDPELADSLVFVNALVNIIPDVTVFIRGDANGDSVVDLSDALTSLHYLYLGDRRPFCFDAADATDDGILDVSDPIRTLGHLFLGAAPLPPPTGEPGEDPTADGLTCFTRE